MSSFNPSYLASWEAKLRRDRIGCSFFIQHNHHQASDERHPLELMIRIETAKAHSDLAPASSWQRAASRVSAAQSNREKEHIIGRPNCERFIDALYLKMNSPVDQNGEEWSKTRPPARCVELVRHLVSTNFLFPTMLTLPS